jgi:hypothetical protein
MVKIWGCLEKYTGKNPQIPGIPGAPYIYEFQGLSSFSFFGSYEM